MKFRKKPVVIEAVQIDKRMDLTSPDWWAQAVQSNQVILHGMGKMTRDMPSVDIPTLEGTMRGDAGDWIIRGVQDELYPCKPDIFAATYEAVGTSSGLDFGEALRALKAGHRVARTGWNGKNMWLALSGPLEGRRIPAANFCSPRNAEYAAQTIDGSANVLPCITMKTAAGDIQMGWLASQADMLAEDWFVIEAAQ